MDLPQFLRDIRVGDEPPRAPKALLYIPPGGRAVHCKSIEDATAAAENYAAQSPGRTVAVYELVGYAFRPIERPQFTSVSSDKAKSELLDSSPDGLVSDIPADGDVEIDRPDLSPEQQESLRHIRRIFSGEDQSEDDSE